MLKSMSNSLLPSLALFAWTNSENPFCNDHKNAYKKLPVILKLFRKPAMICKLEKNRPIAETQRRKSTNGSEEKLEEILMRLLEQYTELENVFKEACRNFKLIFLFLKTYKK
jgi:hypothetical protein